MKKRELIDRARKAWKRLRGGELTPGRAAASVAIGLAIGVTPLWGVHWLLVLGICLPLKLDAGLGYLASNISLPFIAPFITFAEIEAGARVLHGAWLVITVDEAKKLDVKSMVGELAIGTPVVAAACAAIGGSLAYGISSVARRKRATS